MFHVTYFCENLWLMIIEKVLFFWRHIYSLTQLYYICYFLRVFTGFALSNGQQFTLNSGVFPVTKHPFKRAFMPKKSKLNFFWVPYELGSQIVLRIYSESQIFRIFWPIRVSRSLARDMGDQVTPIWAIFQQYLVEIGVTRSNLGVWVNSENYLAS